MECLASNVFTKIKFPRIPKSNPMFITVEKCKVITSLITEEYLKDLCKVAFFTGMRLDKLTNMKWHWIDKNNSIITVKCTNEFNTKSKKKRIIPISPAIESILCIPSSVKQNNYIFSKMKDVRLNNDYVSKKFKKAVRESGLNDKIHFHTLRHSFASVLVQNSVSLYVVKELLGHEDLSTTQIYSHLRIENLFDAVNML